MQCSGHQKEIQNDVKLRISRKRSMLWQPIREDEWVLTKWRVPGQRKTLRGLATQQVYAPESQSNR